MILQVAVDTILARMVDEKEEFGSLRVPSELLGRAVQHGTFTVQVIDVGWCFARLRVELTLPVAVLWTGVAWHKTRDRQVPHTH